MRHAIRGLSAAVGVLLAALPARAGLLPVTVTVTPEAGNYRWTYAIVLPTDSQLRSGDYFTIYDFAGLQTASNLQPDGWSFAVTKAEAVPPGVVPVDNPDLPNLTWRYDGATLGSGQVGLGNFWATSLYSDRTQSFFTARTHRTADGRIDTNITDTTVPVPTAAPIGPSLVPEPATLLLAGLGLPLLALRRVRRRAA